MRREAPQRTRVRLPAGRPADTPGTNTWPRTETVAAHGGPTSRGHRSDYELFNRNNFNIRYWSWNYRGCWHQTCPPIDPRVTKVLKCTHSDYGASDESRIVIFRHYLPELGVGNLRACCLPWMW